MACALSGGCLIIATVGHPDNTGSNPLVYIYMLPHTRYLTANPSAMSKGKRSGLQQRRHQKTGHVASVEVRSQRLGGHTKSILAVVVVAVVVAVLGRFPSPQRLHNYHHLNKNRRGSSATLDVSIVNI